ncbi:hypothetical protein C7122_03950 [Lachnospiraceae bacterium oral taxon 096]|jgi:hypothetical protein|nr:hypothetical protein C7122_03950 [Lachnospiraceae bacterium oral taxon 096]QUI95619.1 hypothetical protein J5A74_09620 [Lachnospiraceae bacterium oral taxon 096]
MVELRNIREKGDIVRCDFYPEDCTTPGTIVYSRGEKDSVVVYPEGYEWCKSHANHAVKFFRNTKQLPSEKIIMWY